MSLKASALIAALRNRGWFIIALCSDNHLSEHPGKKPSTLPELNRKSLQASSSTFAGRADATLGQVEQGLKKKLLIVISLATGYQIAVCDL